MKVIESGECLLYCDIGLFLIGCLQTIVGRFQITQAIECTGQVG